MKKKRILSALLSAALVLSLLPTAAFASGFGGGSGTTDDPYQISTVEQLMAIDDTPENLGKDYILTDDIDLEGEAWTPIGMFTGSGETPDEDTAFHGTFDGNEHTIINLTINGDSNVCAGLFGVVANGTIKDLAVKNANVTGNCMTAAAVGYAYQSTIDNVDLSGTNTIAGKKASGLPTGDAPNMVAGIVGAGMDSTIQNCDVTGTTLTIEGVASASMVGTNAHDIGLVGGGLEGCNLKDCTAAGIITCENNGEYIYGIGGLSGCAVMAESVTNCSADVAISISGGNGYLIGGLLGYTGTTGDAAPSEMTSCTAAGSINASGDRIGQLLGGGYYMDATTAYYPLPARFIVSGSSATTTGTPDLVGYATSLDTVDGSAGANAIFDDGDGSIGNPYEISTAVQLYAVRYGLDQSYKLTNNIDIGATFDVSMGDTYHMWLPIGSYVMQNGEDADRDYAFTGTFDGDGKTISNITVDTSNAEDDNTVTDYTRFGTFGTGSVFNCVADGTVKDLTVNGVNVKGYALVGGAVGYGDHATLTNVKSIGTSGEHNTMEATAMMGGGVIGGCMESTIEGCSAEYVDVTAGPCGNSGALGGGLSHSTVTNCTVDYSTVTATQGGTWLGGLSGCVNWGDAAADDHAFKNCTVSNTTITVGGTASYVGGLTGASGNTLETAADKRAVIDGCKVQNVDITVGENVTCVGGLIGGGLRDGDVPPNSFAIKNCTVDNASSITTAAADLAASAIGTLIGEAYCGQYAKADGSLVDITTTNPVLNATGTDSLATGLTKGTYIGTVLNGSSNTTEFAGGNGTALEPYQIETAEQLNNIRNHLEAHYVLISDIDLKGYDRFEPIGAATMADFDASGNVNAAKAFTGSLDGDHKTISNVTIIGADGLVGVGLFGVTSGTNGEIRDLTVKNVTVTGTASALAVGGVVGYGMSAKSLDSVILTSDNGKTNTITGTNCVGGLVGGGASPNRCTVENTTINLFGDNTTGEDAFTSGRLVQHDVAECGGLIIGGGFGGTITGNTVTNCTINANAETGAKEAVGLGGIGGCLQCMTSITNNTVSGLTINAPAGHAIGGIAGYAGNGNMAAYGYGTNCIISDCTVTGLSIHAANATHVGGLIGTNMYYMGMEGQFEITTGCSVAGSITAGTDNTSIYGISIPGAAAGHAAGCTIGDVTITGLTINGTAAAEKVGTVSVMYESADQDDSLSQTGAGEQLNALFGEYQQLFTGATLETKCNSYWHDAAAAVIGESGADEAVAMLKNSIGAESQAAAIESGDAFYCDFLYGEKNFTFNGTEITVTLANNTTVSHPYKVIGTLNIGEEMGLDGFGGILLESMDENSGEYAYFVMMPDTPAETYHLEFRYGNNLDDLKLYASGAYANWLAAGIPTSAMEEGELTGGQKDNQLRQVIALFCEENLAHDATGALAERSPEALAQLSDFVGIWDANDATLAVMHSYPGFENAKMYVDFKADGTAKTYVASDGVNYAVSSSYNYFAYDNSSSDKAGIYLVDSAEGVSTAPYEIVTSGGKQTLSFYSADGTAAYVKRGSSSDSSGSSGGTSHTVTAPTSLANGSVTVTPKNAAKGDTVTITAVPNSDYVVSTLIVTDASGNKLAVTDKGNGKYTFIMPGSKVNIRAEFQKSSTASGNGFTDVADNAYYKDAVIWAVDEGITEGTSASTFSPDGICTRAQAVTFLWRASGSPVPTTTAMPFNDVPVGSYYYDAVLWAVEQNIIKGTSATTFSPDMNCSRGQIVTMLWRAEGAKSVAVSNPFVDVSGDTYYADAVLWAFGKEITKGTSATTFDPDDNCTRAQIVTFLYRDTK